jgi:hypothetical protein
MQLRIVKAVIVRHGCPGRIPHPSKSAPESVEGKISVHRTMIYPVRCDCGWFGMSDDYKYGLCPWCGRRVVREKEV